MNPETCRGRLIVPTADLSALSGIMGSTVSDSERTKVSTETTDILLAIYAPATIEPRIIEHYARLSGQRMVEFNGGQASDIRALTVTI